MTGPRIKPPAFVEVKIDMARPCARAVAELCKRITWDDCMALSVDRHECESMVVGLAELRRALAAAGVRVW